MEPQPYLEDFVQECVEAYTDTVRPTDDRFATEAIASLISVLVYEALKIALPEIKA